MLGNSDLYAVVATKSLENAKEFYGSTLGLPLVSEVPEAGILIYKSGNSRLQVYQSDYAGTNQATGVSWEVDDIEAAVADPAGKGVVFEHYDFPGSELQGDIHVMGDMKTSWFKDPDGNILCVANKH
jgi:catechol 2,3-dioxygenase-like lactoylglutathione lyase family enzyme